MSAQSALVEPRWLSSEVLDLAVAGPLTGSVTARFGTAVHAEIADFVVALLPPGAPRLPNALAIPAGLVGERAPAVGQRVVLSPGRLTAGRLSIGWAADRPPRWDARLRRWSALGAPALGERALEILGSRRTASPAEAAADALARLDRFGTADRGARQGLDCLLEAVRTRDPRLVALAGSHLVGRGPGLTPLGDDILAATALTVAAAGAAAGWPRAQRRAWLAACAPAGLRRRTTALSATMLELASRGRGVGPVHALLDPAPTSRRRLAEAIDRMTRLGHTTGTAYAVAVGAAALTLATADGRANPQTKENTR